jgi:hypothetical protein
MGIAVFKKWMGESTPAEKKAVAAFAKTSVSILHQLNYEKRSNGKPYVASPDLAGRIASAISFVNDAARHKPLPAVGRGDFASACGKCPYYKSCEDFKE